MKGCERVNVGVEKVGSRVRTWCGAYSWEVGLGERVCPAIRFSLTPAELRLSLNTVIMSVAKSHHIRLPSAHDSS